MEHQSHDVFTGRRTLGPGKNRRLRSWPEASWARKILAVGEAITGIQYSYHGLLIHWADRLRDAYEPDETGRILRMQVAVRLTEDQAVRFMLAAGRDAWSPTLGLIGAADLEGLMDLCGEEAWATLASHEVSAMRQHLQTAKMRGAAIFIFAKWPWWPVPCPACHLPILNGHLWRHALATSKMGPPRLRCSLKWGMAQQPKAEGAWSVMPSTIPFRVR